MPITSKAVQPPNARSASSIGLGAVWPSASSMTSAWPVPDCATNWRPAPSTVVRRNFPSIMGHLKIQNALLTAIRCEGGKPVLLRHGEQGFKLLHCLLKNLGRVVGITAGDLPIIPTRGRV